MAKYIIYMSDEENNIDIEIDVAYKWDVILTLAGADMHLVSGYAGKMLPSYFHVSSRLNIIPLWIGQ